MASLHADAPAAPSTAPDPRSRIGPWLLRALGLVAVPAAVLTIASLLAPPMVRVAADLRLGLDPWTAIAERPQLSLYEFAGRGVAADVLRQFLIAGLVLALARWQDGAAWPRRLALTRPAETRARLGPLWLLLAAWPIVHILWVTETGHVFQSGFGRGIRLSPFLSPLAVVAWLAYVAVLAPVAEEMLMRGEAFARASWFLNPAGTIAATALIFAVAHLGQGGITRPVSLLPLAVTLGWLRWRTGRLWPCMLLHGWSNFALIAYLLWPSLYRSGLPWAGIH